MALGVRMGANLSPRMSDRVPREMVLVKRRSIGVTISAERAFERGPAPLVTCECVWLALGDSWDLRRLSFFFLARKKRLACVVQIHVWCLDSWDHASGLDNHL